MAEIKTHECLHVFLLRAVRDQNSQGRTASSPMNVVSAKENEMQYQQKKVNLLVTWSNGHSLILMTSRHGPRQDRGGRRIIHTLFLGRRRMSSCVQCKSVHRYFMLISQVSRLICKKVKQNKKKSRGILFFKD